MTRIAYAAALQRTGLIDALAAFDPHVAGTPPLGIDLPTSDIDILCHAPDRETFVAVLTRACGSRADFQLLDRPQWPATLCRFTAYGWPFEIFGQPLPVARQHGWRHFQMEARLLDLGGAPFRRAVMALRGEGMKTEPAFAAALGLAGDPYAALLDLEPASDAMLSTLLARAASSRPGSQT